MDSERIAKACRGLPPRKPRGHPQNELRALMFPYLLAGLSPEEARRKALDRAKALLEGILLLEKEERRYEQTN